jgi:hypothetical protein
VWYAAQKAAAELRGKFRSAEYRKPENTLGQDLEQALYGELQKIFVEGGPDARFITPSDSKDGKPGSALMTYEEAIEKGLLPRT